MTSYKVFSIQVKSLIQDIKSNRRSTSCIFMALNIDIIAKLIAVTVEMTINSKRTFSNKQCFVTWIFKLFHDYITNIYAAFSDTGALATVFTKGAY